MANGTAGRGLCQAPFLQLSEFPYTGGFEYGRLCAPVPTLAGSIDCCLPCPVTDWVYPDNFYTLSRIANWLNVGGIVLCIFLLLSYILLPVQRTHRHYLTICLVVGVMVMAMTTLVPLGARPSLCHDAITPNDMKSDLACAWSGSLQVFGGFAAVMWTFLRSLSVHVQICWKAVPGRKFFWGALLAGWGIPAISLALVTSLTGVSYRFGDTCHINHEKSLQTLWGPLLAFAGASVIMQSITLVYCIRVYIRSLLNPDETSQTSSDLPSFNGSVRTVTARAAYKRVSKVIALQWRGIVLVLIIITNVVFFSVVFVKMDNAAAAEIQDKSSSMPWLFCLALNQGNKIPCLDKTHTLVMNEATVIAVLFLLSLNGYWAFLFLGHLSMIRGWHDLLRRPFDRSHEFVSVDARRISDPRNYEMLTSPPQPLYHQKSFDKPATSPLSSDAHSPRDFNPTSPNFGSEAQYRSPSLSFSTPKPPSRSASGASRLGSAHGKERTAVAFVGVSQLGALQERDQLQPSPPAVARTTSASGTNRSNSALGADRSNSALARDQSASAAGWARSGSAMSGERAGSALSRERERDTRPVHARSGAGRSPTPQRISSSLGEGDWDPRSTYARSGTGVGGPEWR